MKSTTSGAVAEQNSVGSNQVSKKESPDASSNRSEKDADAEDGGSSGEQTSEN